MRPIEFVIQARDDLIDLVRLRLDMVSAILLNPRGEPRSIMYAHNVPTEDPDEPPYREVGPLPLGGALGTVAVAVKHEIVLAIVGGLFVLETVSVIVQVASFKLTGKRVFRMAPIHHHFEQIGWKEPTIVIRFWIVAVVLALIGLSTLKLR